MGKIDLYTQGQVDLIDDIKSKLVIILEQKEVTNDNLMFDVIHLLKTIKPLNQ